MAQDRNHLLASPVALALCLSACGGGGMASTPPMPPPPVVPTLTAPAIVAAATSGQEFATKGAAYDRPVFVDPADPVASPSLAGGAQLEVRFNAATSKYEVQLPAGTQWVPLTVAANYSDNSHLYRGPAPDHVGVVDYRPDLHYSALLEWFTDTESGFSAIGIATSPGGVPITGSATYTGTLRGGSSESHYYPWEALWLTGTIRGGISLAFNYGSGTLSGSISPTLYLGQDYVLPPLNFSDTVYASGNTTFSGKFGSGLPGQNSFSGLFTGPAAQELIGNFAFPYISPVDGTTEQAAGAFAGRKP